MKRKLFRQILNEWRSNIWLAVELLLVSAVMWWLCDQLWTRYATYHEPLGYDISHCYNISMTTLNDKSPDFCPYADDTSEVSDLLELKSRLEMRPEIEAVSLSNNSYFYNPNNSYMQLASDTFNGYFLKRWVTPDFFRVFRIYGLNGETPEQLSEIFEKSTWNTFMATDDLFRYMNEASPKSINNLTGNTFLGSDSTEYVLKTVLPSLRYSDYSSAYGNPSIILPLKPEHTSYATEMVVRVKDNMDKDFIQNLMKDAVGNLRVGNWYISSARSFDEIREKFNLYAKQSTVNTVVWSLFLLLNIFLGVLGTFWFRTSQRTPEIALRMANGASHSDIFRRVISEGEIILVAVTPISMAICFLLTHYELNAFYMGSYLTPARFFGCSIITFLLISLMILVGSWLPARKATHISPALALKTE